MLAVAAILIPLAGVFQVFDGLQVVAGGILRGLGETRVAMLVNILGYWLLGLPVSYLLGFRAGDGAGGTVVGIGAGARGGGDRAAGARPDRARPATAPGDHRPGRASGRPNEWSPIPSPGARD